MGERGVKEKRLRRTNKKNKEIKRTGQHSSIR